MPSFSVYGYIVHNQPLFFHSKNWQKEGLLCHGGGAILCSCSHTKRVELFLTRFGGILNANAFFDRSRHASRGVSYMIKFVSEEGSG